MQDNEQIKRQNEKFAAFEKQIMQSAQQRAQKIIDEANAYREKELREAAEAFGRENGEELKQELLLQRVRQISQEKLAARRQLLNYREQLTGNMFADIEKELADFTESAEYFDFLVNGIEQAKSVIGENGAVTLLLSQKDMAHKLQLQQKYPEYNIQADSRIKIGGIKLKNDKILEDKTLDDALQAQYEKFLGYCGLTV